LFERRLKVTVMIYSHMVKVKVKQSVMRFLLGISPASEC